MPIRPSVKNDIIRLSNDFNAYLAARQNGESLTQLQMRIRNLRMAVQHMLLEYYLLFTQEEEHHFQDSLGKELKFGNSDIECRHHNYCIKEIVACFQWASQIKREIPDDHITLKVLAVDIPILRPFDYGLND